MAVHFYAPDFEKVGSILVLACPFVPKKIKARILKFHIWIPHEKIADPYFFSCPYYFLLCSYAPFQHQRAICKQAISKSIDLIFLNYCPLQI